MPREDVESLWASMQTLEHSNLLEYSSRYNQREMLESQCKLPHKKNIKLTKKAKENVVTSMSTPLRKKLEAQPTLKLDTCAESKIQNLTAEEIILKISRYIELCKSDDTSHRRQGIQNLRLAFQSEKSQIIMNNDTCNEIFNDISKILFKLFSDPIEKCRETSLSITLHLLGRSSDYSLILGYFFPSIFRRLGAGEKYDTTLKVFVNNGLDHEAFLRGRAVDRQDKVMASTTMNPTSFIIIEPAEELRLLAMRTISTLIYRTLELGSFTMLQPYFQDIILCLEYQLGDPFSELKAEVCRCLTAMAKELQFNSGMVYYSVGLVRALLPTLRHHHSKVRVVAVEAVCACMCVPDKSKRKGAGTEAIMDLVGFEEANILQVASFYQPTARLNYMAELVIDQSVAVKEAVVHFLTECLTQLEDRYDHQTRLLPYLLDLITDASTTVSSGALSCLTKCGIQYEQEHSDEVLEKLQYGVDGDDRTNHSKKLPHPFTNRPRIGVRLYARGNVKRFLTALLGELTSWQARTRLKSVALLKVVVILCEEHLTVDAHQILPSILRSLIYAKENKEADLHSSLLEVLELLGRYLTPSVYVHFVIPRLRGDADVAAFGTDTETRVAALELLSAMFMGSKPAQLAPYFESVVNTITDRYIVDPYSKKLVETSVRLMKTLLNVLSEKPKVVTEAIFTATGRLPCLYLCERSLFRFLWCELWSADATVRKLALEALQALPRLTLTNSTDFSASCNVHSLYLRHSEALLSTLSEGSNVDSELLGPCSTEHRLIVGLLLYPWFQHIVYSIPPSTLLAVLQYLCNRFDALVSTAMAAPQNDDLQQLSELGACVFAVLVPIVYTNRSITCVSKEQSSACCVDSWMGDVNLQSGNEHCSVWRASMLKGLYSSSFSSLEHSQLNFDANCVNGCFSMAYSTHIDSESETQLEVIISRYFSHQTWLRSTCGNSFRIAFLKLLTGTDSETKAITVGRVSIILGEMKSNELPVLLYDANNQNNWQSRTVVNMLKSILEEGTKPSISVSGRCESVTLVTEFVQQNIFQKTRNQQPVRSFRPEFRSNSTISGGNSVYMYEQWMAHVSTLMQLLGDSSDEVRVCAVEALCVFSACGVIYHKAANEQLNDCAAQESDIDVHTPLEDVVARLLIEVPLSSEPVLIQIEVALTSLATVNRELVERLTRDALNVQMKIDAELGNNVKIRLNDGQLKKPSTFYVDLLSHCDTIKCLAKLA